MAKRPDDRYSDCLALAEDLGRWLEGEPIRARRLSGSERFVRWCRREPKLALASALTAVSLLVLTAAVGLFGVRHFSALYAGESAQHGQTRVKLQESEESLGKARTTLDEEQAGHARTRRDYNLEFLIQARARLDADDRAGAYLVLQRCAVEFRGWAWHHLLLQAEGAGLAVRILQRPDFGPVGSIAFSRDSQFLASLGVNGPICFWHVGAGKGLRTLPLAAHDGWPRVTAFSADGRVAAAVYIPPPKAGIAPKAKVRAEDAFAIAAQVAPKGLQPPPPAPTVLVVWNAVTGEKLHVLEGPAGEQVFLQLSGNGARLAVSAGNWNQPAEVRVFDTATGKEAPEARKRLTGLRQLALAPDGKTVAAISGDWTKPPAVSFWDAQNGKDGLTLEGAAEGLEHLAFSGDGKLIVGVAGGVRKVTETVMITTIEKRTRKRPDGKEETYEVTVSKPVTVEKTAAGGDARMRVCERRLGQAAAHAAGLRRLQSGDCGQPRRRAACQPLPGPRAGPGGEAVRLAPGPGRADAAGAAGLLPGSARLQPRLPAPGGRPAGRSPGGPVERHCRPAAPAVRRPRRRRDQPRLQPRRRPALQLQRVQQLGAGVGGADGQGPGGRPGRRRRLRLRRLRRRRDGLALAFSGDGRRVMTQSTPSSGCYGMFPGGAAPSMWDRQTGKPIDFPKDVGRVLAVSPDGALIVTAPEPAKFVPPAAAYGLLAPKVRLARPARPSWPRS